jgi:predicted lipoprotein
MSKETVFVDGMICKRKENAPDFVVCNISVKKSEMIPFLNAQSGDWVNVQVLKAKSGDKIYAKLDTWEPDPAKVHADGTQQVRNTLATKAEETFADDIPF